MKDMSTQESAEWPVVQTDAGPVTLAPVGALQARADQWREWAASAAATAQSLRSQAEDRFAGVGSSLVARSREWAVPSDLEATVQQAAALSAEVSADNQRAAALKDVESAAGIFGWIGIRHSEHGIERERSEA